MNPRSRVNFNSILGTFVVAAGMTSVLLPGSLLAEIPSSPDPVVAERELQLEQARSTYLERFRRLYQVGSKIRIANADLCGKSVAAEYGFLLSGQLNLPFPERQEVREGLRKEEARVLLIVTPGLPAYEAGLREGDVVERMVHVASGQSLFPKPPKRPKSAAYGGKGRKRSNHPENYQGFRIMAGLLSSVSDKGIEVSFARGGYVETVLLKPAVACAFTTYLALDDGVNASAHGSSVVVNYGMMRFLESDDELALLLGHEYSHNVLGHLQQKRVSAGVGALIGTLLDVQILETTGVYTPTFGRAGYSIGSLSFSEEMESHSDHLGGYFARRAGYDISAGIPFWRRMGIESPSSIMEGGFLASHPPAPDRVNNARLLLAEIEELERLGCPLDPDLENLKSLDDRPRTAGPGARMRRKKQQRLARDPEDSGEALSVLDACRRANMHNGR